MGWGVSNFEPSRTKFRKSFKAYIVGNASAGSTVEFGDYGLKACTGCRISSRQIEAARRVATRFISKRGKLWIRVFPDCPVTAKPAASRMGKGKGNVDHWVFKLQPGRVVFEVCGISRDEARLALLKAACKLPAKFRFVENMSC